MERRSGRYFPPSYYGESRDQVYDHCCSKRGICFRSCWRSVSVAQHLGGTRQLASCCFPWRCFCYEPSVCSETGKRLRFRCRRGKVIMAKKLVTVSFEFDTNNYDEFEGLEDDDTTVIAIDLVNDMLNGESDLPDEMVITVDGVSTPYHYNP